MLQCSFNGGGSGSCMLEEEERKERVKFSRFLLQCWLLVFCSPPAHPCNSLLYAGANSGFKTASARSYNFVFTYSSFRKHLHGLWNPEIQCLVHKDSPIIPILSRINPILLTDKYFNKVYSIIILPSMSSSYSSLALQPNTGLRLHNGPPPYPHVPWLLLPVPNFEYFYVRQYTIHSLIFRSSSYSSTLKLIIDCVVYLPFLIHPIHLAYPSQSA